MNDEKLLIAIKHRLWEYYQAKQVLKKLRLDLTAMAVDVGFDQSEVYKADVCDLLNGYLLGKGVGSNYKRETENEGQ